MHILNTTINPSPSVFNIENQQPYTTFQLGGEKKQEGRAYVQRSLCRYSHPRVKKDSSAESKHCKLSFFLCQFTSVLSAMWVCQKQLLRYAGEPLVFASQL
jgi:hypothetical protein